jgi:ketosteroid isomerase-like protein
MRTHDWVRELFTAIDAGDATGFGEFLADDAAFRFGNAEPVHGKTAIVDAVKGFFGSIKSVHHEIEESWFTDGAVIVHGTATYTSHDGGSITVPFCNVFKMSGDRIREYLIYVDVSGLYV